MEKKQRIEYFDIAKGIGILCIVAGHMGIEVVGDIVFTFHVPLFLIISGYFISTADCFCEFVKKKYRCLLLPYVYTSFALILLQIILNLLNGKNKSEILLCCIDFLKRACYGSGSSFNNTLFNIELIGAIWFLLALFWSSLLVKILYNKKYGVVIIIIVAIISYITSKYVWLPFDIQAGATAAVFVYIGACLKKKGIFDRINPLFFILGIVCFCIEVYFSVFLSIARNYFKYTIVSVIGAVLISYSVICISKMIEKMSRFKIIEQYLRFCGENSMYSSSRRLFTI